MTLVKFVTIFVSGLILVFLCLSPIILYAENNLSNGSSSPQQMSVTTLQERIGNVWNWIRSQVTRSPKKEKIRAGSSGDEDYKNILVGPHIQPLKVGNTKTKEESNELIFSIYKTPFLDGEGLPSIMAPTSKSDEVIFFSVSQVNPMTGQLKMIRENFCQMKGRDKITCDSKFAFVNLPKNAAYVVSAVINDKPYLQTVVFGPRIKSANQIALSPSTTAATQAWLHRVRFHRQQKNLPDGRRTVDDYEKLYAKLHHKYRDLARAFQKLVPAGTMLPEASVEEFHRKTREVLLSKDIKSAQQRAIGSFMIMAQPYVEKK